MEKRRKLNTGQRGLINEIFVFIAILMIIGLYSITFNSSILTLVANSPNYGPSSDLYLLFVGVGLFIVGVSFYTLFYPRPQSGF